MSRRFVFASLCAIALSVNSYSHGQDDKMKLQGTWACASAVIDGKPLAEEAAKALKLTLTADRYKTERGDQVLFDSTYTIDAAKNPKTIDMVGTEGELKGKPALGIYTLDGDMLSMAYVMPGKDRPTTFESKAGSGIYVIVWKRKQ